MSWLLGHLGSAGLHAALGIGGHLGTEALGFLRDRSNNQRLEKLAALKVGGDVQAASYAAAPDWMHWSLVLTLIGLFTLAAWTGAPDSLTDPLTDWTSLGLGWSFGRLTTRRKR